MSVESSPELRINEPAAAPKAQDNGYVSRDGWLAQSGKFKEEEIEVDGLGKVLLMEISGTVRAQIQSQQSRGLLADARSVDAVSYQRALLLAGVADPKSPEDARTPLFQKGDMDRVMGIGGGKIQQIVDVLEKLSGLGAGAVASAEENSGPTPSAAGTSQ